MTVRRQKRQYQGYEEEQSHSFGQSPQKSKALQVKYLSKNCQCIDDNCDGQLESSSENVSRKRQKKMDESEADKKQIRKEHKNGQTDNFKNYNLVIKTPNLQQRERSLCEPLQASMFKKLVIKLKSQVTKILQLLHLVETYQSTGWKDSQTQKIQLTHEVERAKTQITSAVKIIRDVVRACDECEGDAKLDADLFGGSGEIYCESIVCCRCQIQSPASNFHEDDVVLCDADGCRRAYHTKCINPQVNLQELGENEGWWCPSCDCKFDLVCALHHAFDLTYELRTPWYDILPDPNILLNLPETDKKLQDNDNNLQQYPQQKEDKSTLDWRRMLESQLHSEDESNDQDFQQTTEQTDNSNNESNDGDLATQLDNDDSDTFSKNKVFVAPQPQDKINTESLDDLTSINLGKRERCGVDYQTLNQHLFGKQSNLNYESDENDDDYQP